MGSFRFLSSALLLATALLQSLPASAAEGGKFHLVYLVSAVDLKPGSKVFVDPIFFTDGKDVKNFHDYCNKKEQFLSPKQIVGDLSFIDDYCAKKNYSLSAKDYATLNNHGQSISLEAIEFNVVDAIERTSEEVMIGNTKVSSYGIGAIDPPHLPRGDGAPEYFFLMSRDRGILEKMIPVSKVSSAEMQVLLKRARQFSETSKGRAESGEYRFLKEDFRPVGSTKLANPIFTDIDADGKADLVVNLEARYQPIAGKTAPYFRWLSVAYITGADGSVLGYWPEVFPMGPYKTFLESEDAYARFLANGYPVMTPLLAIRLGNCGYVIRYLEDRGMKLAHGIYMEHKFAIQSQKRNCSNIVLPKLQPPM